MNDFLQRKMKGRIQMPENNCDHIIRIVKKKQDKYETEGNVMYWPDAYECVRCKEKFKKFIMGSSDILPLATTTGNNNTSSDCTAEDFKDGVMYKEVSANNLLTELLDYKMCCKKEGISEDDMETRLIKLLSSAGIEFSR